MDHIERVQQILRDMQPLFTTMRMHQVVTITAQVSSYCDDGYAQDSTFEPDSWLSEALASQFTTALLKTDRADEVVIPHNTFCGTCLILPDDPSNAEDDNGHGWTNITIDLIDDTLTINHDWCYRPCYPKSEFYEIPRELPPSDAEPQPPGPGFDAAAYYAHYLAHEAWSNKQLFHWLLAGWHQIEEHNIKFIWVEYDGAGDSGGISEVTVDDEATAPQEWCKELEQVFEQLASENFDNAGSEGRIEIDVAARVIRKKHVDFGDSGDDGASSEEKWIFNIRTGELLEHTGGNEVPDNVETDYTLDFDLDPEEEEE